MLTIMSKYKTMLLDAKKKGLTNESKMWESVADIEPILDKIEEEHPEMYDEFMCKQHKRIYGAHFTPDYAEEAIDKLKWTDKNGQQHTGAHWTKAQVLEATKSKPFAAGVTDCDKYVAFNAAYAKLNKKHDDEKILDIAYDFFFDDNKSTKVWDYMMSKDK